jgi:membrane peptidoglycan carboxypeptidase
VRRRLWLVAAVLAAALPVVVILAWSTSPDGTGLGRRLHARLQGTNGRSVALSRVSPWLRDAVVATEDERFYRHHGIDVIGVLRALPYDLVHLSFAQGASTITEQVAKVLYLNGNDHSLWRKLEDAAVAVKLENRYDKEQILGAYLNSVYFGEGASGVWRASRRYFGVSPRSLDLAQASLLAGLIQAPSAYDPLRDPPSARARQVDVLRAMVADGLTTAAEAATALGRSLRLRGGVTLPPVRGVNLAQGPAFVWWQLALGAVTATSAVAALLASRLPRFRATHGTVVIRAMLLALCLLGAAVAVRSFRTA